ncbi:hypothetical protein ACCD10_01910 [Pseudomonas sp. Pseusp122]|uniref:hypothetical protein n=1 Tax=unclassified Pseudomonas TaxID=196821 RepID=UPI0039A68708
MSLNQLQTPPNRVSRTHEMQREDFLALACAIQRFQAAEAQATLAIVGAKYGYERPPSPTSDHFNDS